MQAQTLHFSFMINATLRVSGGELTRFRDYSEDFHDCQFEYPFPIG